MSTASSTNRNDQIGQAVAARKQTYLHLLEQLVAIDSGSLDHAGVRRMTDAVETLLTAEGLDVERVPAGDLDVLVARRRGNGPTILLNAHLDTVFEPGAAAERPFSIDDQGIARGPGVADDKCGIVSALMAVQVLNEVGSDADIMIVLTPDEELGSPVSAPITAKLSMGADVALCLEAARANGDLVSARKGGLNMTVEITGRSAHSGVEPEKGIHAGLQLAHTIIGLQALNDWDAGITVNAGQATLGTRSNIVPDQASIWVDARAWTVEDFDSLVQRAETVIRTPYVDGIVVDSTREVEAPPMEATPAAVALADLAVAVAAEIGFDVAHVATGGIGDANLVATAGIPVLDGLAPIGGDDHTTIEWLDTASIVPRVTLLTALIDRLATDGVPSA